MTDLSREDRIKIIQLLVGVEPDGVAGKLTDKAVDLLLHPEDGLDYPFSGTAGWYSQNAGPNNYNIPDTGAKYNWIDKGDGRWNKVKTKYLGPNNALGVEDVEQGIALLDKSTLGKWFDVMAPNGIVLRLQQTDIGPAKWTKRAIDVAAVAAEAFKYTPINFPTGTGVFRWRLSQAEGRGPHPMGPTSVSAQG